MAEQYAREWQEAAAEARAAALRTPNGAFQTGLQDPPDIGAGAHGALGAVCAHAEDYFISRMPRSWAPGYLGQRGFGAGVQREWGAGYAPAAWTTLTDHLRDRGHSDDAIEAAGLAIRSARGTLVDLFRDRVMLPIRNEHGATVAFIGRAAPGTETGRHPKYLNSPGTDLYRKGEVLFGLPQAAPRIASGASPVIVEGPFDAIAFSATGPTRFAGLAPCGTALTADHVAALGRTADIARTGVLVALDGDRGGRRGMIAAYRVLSAVTDHTYGVVLPPGSDPAEILRTAGPAALNAGLAREIRPLADIVLDSYIDQRVIQLAGVRSYDGADWVTAWEGRNLLMAEAARRIVAMPPAHWERQLTRLAGRFHLPRDRVFGAFLDAHTAAEETPKGLARPADDRRAGPQARGATATPAETAAAGFPASPIRRLAAADHPPAPPTTAPCTQATAPYTGR
jgi:DNA primase